ncbi:choline/ethanolamine kinase family protein [Dongia sedimenti]|uniref:Choline/ethanolamine kinase family protein n=1 Tax=Dongia sedimenti TaxID=3064282 RepID=A0ABU0YX95_9PROT|nr:choline/ethanolamine kinase family protein [Rhodospirillaceae bacterium R-7]
MTGDPTLQTLLGSVPLLAARDATAWQVRPLAGLTNRNWRLTAGDADFVLRAPGASSQRYLSRSQEFHNAAIAAELGIAPALLYADAATGVTLQPFLADARALTPEDFARPELARKIGSVFARLHRSGRIFEGTMQAFPIIDTYLGLAADDRLRRLRAQAEPIRAALEAHPVALVPSHIDPNPANFLLRGDGTLLLIDWEFSAMCDPAWDLAAIGMGGRISHADFREAYGALPGESRLWLMRAALHLVAGSWTYAEIAGGNAAPGLDAMLERYLGDLERMLGHPALKRHLAVLA